MTDRVPAWTLAVGAMMSVQIGAALSTHLFPAIGPVGTVWLRLTVAAVFFLAIARPSLAGLTARELRTPVALGVMTGVMTVFFVLALDRIPLGTVVAIEFLGPLGVAVVRSRDRRGLLWPLLAFAGVVLLTEPWTGTVDPLGVLYAALAGVGWAAYIVLTQQVGDRFSGMQGLAITMPVAAVVAAFVGVPQAVGGLTWQVLGIAVALAVLLPILPFALELQALRRLTTAAFGTLMALEPGIATLVGAVLLAQIPGLVQVVGVALVVVAGVGAERSGHREPGPPDVVGEGTA
ncbi:EamA family transporter [Longivirga aurantiaca]|uniref:DMT family transporter n=1 Tax=Longivirga aurantiaca TaxID=1837743 RepID=A0ABW1SYM4_9ACTN